MVPGPAQYLLRFDDMSPDMNPALWLRFGELIRDYQLQPILAVIPDHHRGDRQEKVEDPDFWDEMRRLEASGAAIAAHGYRHLCLSRGKSLLGLHRRTEFAGVDYETQRDWIHAGNQILEDHGLHPRLWVAPRHGFDSNTLRALRDEGMKYLSDGFARAPVWRGGMTWIPQQLWGPATKERGLWTICVHPETARSSEVESLRQFLREHNGQFTSFERVVAEWPPQVPGPLERVYEMAAQWRVQRRHTRARRRAGRH